MQTHTDKAPFCSYDAHLFVQQHQHAVHVSTQCPPHLPPLLLILWHPMQQPLWLLSLRCGCSCSRCEAMGRHHSSSGLCSVAGHGTAGAEQLQEGHHFGQQGLPALDLLAGTRGVQQLEIGQVLQVCDRLSLPGFSVGALQDETHTTPCDAPSADAELEQLMPCEGHSVPLWG